MSRAPAGFIGIAKDFGFGPPLQALPTAQLPEASRALGSIFAHNMRCVAASMELAGTIVAATSPLDRLTARERWLRTCAESFLGCAEGLDATALRAACTYSDLLARSLDVEDSAAAAPVL